jgi:hypothetical protein
MMTTALNGLTGRTGLVRSPRNAGGLGTARYDHRKWIGAPPA